MSTDHEANKAVIRRFHSATYNEIFTFRFAEGRIAETWGVVDVVSQMKQLGVV